MKMVKSSIMQARHTMWPGRLLPFWMVSDNPKSRFRQALSTTGRLIEGAPFTKEARSHDYNHEQRN